MANSVFDVVIIGTSPVLLIEAISQSNQGQNVLIIERRSQLGGAWYTETLWDQIHVEVGCHYIERASRTYQFLTEHLGACLQDEPRHIMWHNIHEKTYIDSFQQRLWHQLKAVPQAIATNRPLSRNFWNLLLALKHRSRDELRHSIIDLFTSRQYRYPIGGIRTLLNQLHDQAKRTNVTFWMETAVQTAHCQSQQAVDLTLADGRSISATKVITGQQPNISIYIEGTQIEIPRHDNTNIHVIYHIQGAKTHPFGYLEVVKDRYLRRIADISHFSNCATLLAESDQLLICCHVEKEPFEPSNSPLQLFTYLKEDLKLVTPDSQLINFHVEEYRSDSYIDRETREQLEQTLPPSIEILYTYDLGKAIDRYSETRWTTMPHQHSLLADEPT